VNHKPLKIETTASGSERWLSPATVNLCIENAITWCWNLLPADARTPERVEAEIRARVERALDDFEHDWATFAPEEA